MICLSATFHPCVRAALDSLAVGWQAHIMALEAADTESQQALLAGMEYLLSISFVDDDEARSPMPQFPAPSADMSSAGDDDDDDEEARKPMPLSPRPYAALGATRCRGWPLHVRTEWCMQGYAPFRGCKVVHLVPCSLHMKCAASASVAERQRV